MTALHHKSVQNKSTQSNKFTQFTLLCALMILVSFSFFSSFKVDAATTKAAKISKTTNIQFPTLNNIKLKEPKLSAKSYLLIDYNSGKIIAQKDIDKIVEPASLTKMMTMYVIDQELRNGNINLNDKVLVSKKAWKTEGSRMFLEVGSSVKLSEIINGIIISSANDGCVAVAEHIAGSEETFIDIMNTYANLLGMNNTNFVNATGLPHKNHYTTSRDMAVLAKALISNFPGSYRLYSKRSHTHLGIKQFNRNKLLWSNNFVDGIKTGHTESAGFCLVASAKNPKNAMRLISVVMGTKNDATRSNETNKLLTWGFRFFETHKLYEKSHVLDNLPIYMGKEKTLAVGLNEDLYITVKKELYKQLKASIDTTQIIKAPTNKGDVIGTFTIKHNDKVLIEKPIIALHTIESGNLFTKIGDYITLTFKSLMKKINL